MTLQSPRYFQATHRDTLYRVYVTPFDLLCVRVGREANKTSSAGWAGGVIGALIGGVVGGLIGRSVAEKIARPRYADNSVARIEWEIEQEGAMLDKRDVKGIRTYHPGNNNPHTN